MLVILRDTVKEIAKIYADIKSLKEFDEQLTIVLCEEISKIIENAEIQSRTMKNHLKTDVFAERLCEYLDTRKKTRGNL
jgi:hypothetical protein